jgi:protein-tyrosine phosphatase
LSFVDYAISQFHKGESILSGDGINEVIPDISIEKAIDDAVYRTTHQYDSRQFLTEYAPLHKVNPKISTADAIRQISEKLPDIPQSERTLHQWISDYKEALKRYDTAKK